MFSEKYGYTPEKIIQHEKISDVLRRRIWNLYYLQEIKDGGLTSKQLIQVINGKQTLDEKIVDRLGFLIKPTVKGKSAQEQLES